MQLFKRDTFSYKGLLNSDRWYKRTWGVLFYSGLGYAGVFLVTLLSILIVTNGNVSYMPTPTPTPTVAPVTGQQVMDAVNAYRIDKKLPELKLSSALCNNIAQWAFDLDANKDAAHPGFKTWVSEDKRRNTYHSVSEIVTGTRGRTIDQVMSDWTNSPSHKLALDNATYNEGCSYSGLGYAIVELGIK